MTGGQTVFVVDDDAAIRKSLSLWLKEQGFAVEALASAKEFLDAAAGDRPGCLILDVRMPSITGLELQDILRGRGTQIPIIFISGHGDIPMAVRAMREGAVDFLEKPYQLPILLARVKEALANDRNTRQAQATNQVVRMRYGRLSERERQVMALIVGGAATTSNRAVAEQLQISRRTVETYRARLMEKMQARSLPELVEMATKCGVRQPHSD